MNETDSLQKRCWDRPLSNALILLIVLPIAIAWDWCSFIRRHRNRIAEIIVTIGMCATLFVLIRQYAVGVPNNSTNMWCFTAACSHGYHLQQPGDGWKGRIFAFLMAGWFTDQAKTITSYINLFALYQTLWIGLLMAAVIMAINSSRSLLINLMIFAGMVWNVTPDSCLYWYSWDSSSTFFFFLSALFFERKQSMLILLSICVGAMFKETTLCCCLLFLFLNVKWWKRVLLFSIPFMSYVLVKTMMLHALGFHTAAWSENNATGLSNFWGDAFHKYNIKAMFVPYVDTPFLMNCGTITAAALVMWRRRFLPYICVIVLFTAGMMTMGSVCEYHDWMQIIPMCAMMVATRSDEDSHVNRSGALNWFLIATCVAVTALVISQFQSVLHIAK